jgi:hypothetical protein
VQPAGLFRRNAEAYLRFAALQRLLSRILRFTSLTAEAHALAPAQVAWSKTMSTVCPARRSSTPVVIWETP